jgi:hypothetical protein
LYHIYTFVGSAVPATSSTPATTGAVSVYRQASDSNRTK